VELETERCTTLEFELAGPTVLVATTITSSPIPGAVPIGTVKSTWTFPDSPVPKVISCGITWLTNRRASVTVILNLTGGPIFRSVNVNCFLFPAGSSSNSLPGKTSTISAWNSVEKKR
jgi:hypothetical protein